MINIIPDLTLSYRLVPFTDVKSLTINVYSDMSFSCEQYDVSQYYTRGKIAYLRAADHSTAADHIERRSSFYKIKPGGNVKTIYVSSHSKYPRDILRKSYAITRNPDSADAYVVPHPKTCPLDTCSFAVLHDKTLYMCYIRFRFKSFKSFDEVFNTETEPQNREAIFNCIADYLSCGCKDMEVYLDKSLNNSSITIDFLQNFPEYIDMLSQNAKYKYVFDSDILVETDNKISIDTLDIWKKYPHSDYKILEKQILNSDWQKYPFTLAAFLEYECGDCAEYYFGEQGKMVLDMIGYERITRERNQIPISPEDWSMFQKRVLHLAGIDNEEHGFISPETFSKLPKFYVDKLRMKICIGTTPVNHEAYLQNLITNSANRSL